MYKLNEFFSLNPVYFQQKSKHNIDLQNEQQLEGSAAHARCFQHVHELGLALVRLLGLFAVVLLTVAAERLEVIVGHLSAIDLGHALQPPEGTVDVASRDQPLGALLDEEVVEGDQQ